MRNTSLIALLKQVAWHYFFCASNLVTDLSIILQALFLIVRLHAPVKKRFLFASIFMTRLLYDSLHDFETIRDRRSNDLGFC